MQQDDANIQLKKARKFFERADDVAATDNFEYAIDMYLKGLRFSPDALEDGHAALRKIALIRQGEGGKKPSVMEKMKHHGGKTPVDELLNAEYLLARDPDHLPYAETMLKASVAGGLHRTAEWVAHLVFEANRALPKPSLSAYLLLKDSYTALEMFGKAAAVCKLAMEIKSDNGELASELKDLSAKLTMQRGNYGQPNGSFQNSLKNKDAQEKIYTSDKIVKSMDFREKAVIDAKNAYEQNPSASISVLKYAEALYALGTEKGYDAAINFLQKSYERTKDFSFKRREGEMKIKRLKNGVRKASNAVKENPSDGKLKNHLAVEFDLLNKAELEHFALNVKEYPTDLAIKYDYALCLIKNKRYDEAIPLLQEAQKDPRRKIQAMDETGLCFFLKGWFADAIDIFENTLKLCEVKDDQVAKDIRYNLARSCEEDGQAEKALELYRKLAQLDFAYKDVSQRVNRLRQS